MSQGGFVGMVGAAPLNMLKWLDLTAMLTELVTMHDVQFWYEVSLFSHLQHIDWPHLKSCHGNIFQAQPEHQPTSALSTWFSRNNSLHPIHCHLIWVLWSLPDTAVEWHGSGEQCWCGQPNHRSNQPSQPTVVPTMVGPTLMESRLELESPLISILM